MKSIIIPTVLLSAHSSHAFQIAPSLRTKITTSPPILIPHHVSLQRRNILQESSPISVLYNSINDNIKVLFLIFNFFIFFIWFNI